MKEGTDHSFRLLAARYMGKHARKLAKQLDGACWAEDIESVHQSRVVSRRLRAALQLFRHCFQRKQWAHWKKHIRQVTSGLGAARDKDVQIEYVTGILAELRDEARVPGIARLLVQLEREREELQPQVVAAVQYFQASGVLNDIRKVTSRTIKRNNGKQVSLRSSVAAKQTRKAIRERLGGLIAYEDCLDDPDDSEHHHAMRIAAKQLRYTVEMSNPVYDGGLSEHSKIVKQVQTFLGDIHDCDVWAEDLRAFARAEKRRITARFGDDGPYERLRPGIEYLAQTRVNQRAAIFSELVEFWREIKVAGQWDRMIETINSGHKRTAPSTSIPQKSPTVETLGSTPADERQAQAGRSRPHVDAAGHPMATGSHPVSDNPSMSARETCGI